MTVGTHRNQIVSINPVPDASVNKGQLCVKGRYDFDFVDAADRITVPMVGTNDGWRPLSWDEAISLTVRRLQEISKEDGPNSIDVLGSACATNEENYLTQKFARVVIGYSVGRSSRSRLRAKNKHVTSPPPPNLRKLPHK